MALNEVAELIASSWINVVGEYQIIFVLNELNIKIYSTDAEALNKWKDILEENK
jgi:hypothetical protein